jgi:hypothetical protein
VPVDHDRQFLFVHVPKTGGTTILTVLGLWRSQRQADPRTLFGDFAGFDLQHLTLVQAAQFLTAEEYARYYKFAFVRNPWDRAVSAALWRTRFREEGIRDLRDYVAWAEAVIRLGPRKPSDVHALPQSAFLVGPSGELELDHIGRFETLASDFAAIAARLSVPPGPLPHKLRHDERGPFHDYYQGDLQARVGRLYAEDAWRFGYRFGTLGAR